MNFIFRLTWAGTIKSKHAARCDKLLIQNIILAFMKTLLTIFICLIFSISANCQSLTFQDLLFLTHQQSAKAFLTKKNFIFSDDYKSIEFCYKNSGIDSAERVMFDKSRKSPSYIISDTTYMHKIIGQVKKAYTLIIKDVSGHETFYHFGSPSINIMIDIIRTPPCYGKISVTKR